MAKGEALKQWKNDNKAKQAAYERTHRERRRAKRAALVQAINTEG